MVIIIIEVVQPVVDQTFLHRNTMLTMIRRRRMVIMTIFDVAQPVVHQTFLHRNKIKMN